jgi:hypothetical protein
MNTLYFEKISQFDRIQEPVSVSIPFGKGKLTTSHDLAIRDGDTDLPVQTRPLAHWDDGSVKWMLAHFQTDLPGNKDKTLHVDIRDTNADVALAHQVQVTEHAKGYHVATGILEFDVPNDGFYPVTDVKLNGERLWDDITLAWI